MEADSETPCSENIEGLRPVAVGAPTGPLLVVNHTWTLEREIQLRTLWFTAKWSKSRIAAEMGVSKNVIAGKI